jgi:transposase-like protein
MKGKRRKFSPQFKANVAIEAIKERYTLSELAEKFNVSGVMISRWKKEFLENSSKAFGVGVPEREKEVDSEKLYAQIGQLKVENDFLKKSFKRTGLSWKDGN